MKNVGKLTREKLKEVTGGVAGECPSMFQSCDEEKPMDSMAEITLHAFSHVQNVLSSIRNFKSNLFKLTSRAEPLIVLSFLNIKKRQLISRNCEILIYLSVTQ